MISIMTEKKQNKKTLGRIGAVLLTLLIWQLFAMLLNEGLLLASPLQVIARLFSLWGEPGFFEALLFSASRIVGGFLLGFAAGVILAVLAGRFPVLETLLWPFVVSIKSIPVASFIIISLIFFTSRQLSVFISFLMVFPVIYANVLEGIKSTDPKLMEMAKLYGLSWKKRLFYIHLPQLKPFLFSACSVALGLAWKSGVAAEVIGIPGGSIGEKLYQAKIYFDTADLFAWTVIIVLFSQLFERLFLLLIKFAFRQMEKR